VNIVAALTLPIFLLSGLGLLMMRAHYRSWKIQRDQECDPEEQNHLARRYRRRMQASGLLVLLGILISAGQLIDGKSWPTCFTVYWTGVLLLTFWLILLALGDAASIAAYSKAAQGKLDQQRREIEAEFQKLKARQGNGHPDTSGDANNSRESEQ